MATPSPLLDVDALSVSLAGHRIVEAVSLQLAPGERVAIQAPSGAGKTTLLRAIAQLAPSTSGAVRLRGQTFADKDLPRFRREVVWVSQRATMSTGSVRDTLALPFTFTSTSHAFDPKLASQLLARLGVAGRLDDPAARLSEGQQKRVALVRALLLRPVVLLLDEPTTGLDHDARDAVEALLIERANDGVGMLVVTHDPAQAERFCHRVADVTTHLLGARSRPDTTATVNP